MNLVCLRLKISRLTCITRFSFFTLKFKARTLKSIQARFIFINITILIIFITHFWPRVLEQLSCSKALVVQRCRPNSCPHASQPYVLLATRVIRHNWELHFSLSVHCQVCLGGSFRERQIGKGFQLYQFEEVHTHQRVSAHCPVSLSKQLCRGHESGLKWVRQPHADLPFQFPGLNFCCLAFPITITFPARILASVSIPSLSNGSCFLDVTTGAQIHFWGNESFSPELAARFSSVLNFTVVFACSRSISNLLLCGNIVSCLLPFSSA